ncbi:MAG: carboxypeptidase-like regulatory domain-containing protein, partial [Candidatus Sulfotelmatobacter sp.]
MRLGMVRHFGRLFVLLVAGLTATFAFGQNANTGEIRGMVQDTTGAVIGGVKVTILNVRTGVSIVSVTNSDGIYDVPSVPTGEYMVTFSKAGFKEFVRKGLTLEIQTIAVDGTLQVGNVSEQLVVTAETPLVETETSDQR